MVCMFKVIHYYVQIYLKTLEMNVLKYMNLILLIFYLHLARIRMARMFKENRNKIRTIS